MDKIKVKGHTRRTPKGRRVQGESSIKIIVPKRRIMTVVANGRKFRVTMEMQQDGRYKIIKNTPL
jgi:hypothetical protein